jgi:superfamily II DNA or RNA helicase
MHERPPHPIQRLYRAEDLYRRRRADEGRRHVSSQRAALIDPNPHQVDAVVFALGRLAEGGCILADEVGLGKTIEAGLVIAQLLAEGAERILVVTPKALLGQWKQELYSLFAIDAREVARGEGFEGRGVLLATRDLVGSEAGAARLRAVDPFDLCVIDEAHEVFAGIYRRFDRHGGLQDDSPYARMAGRLSGALRASGTPILLLTATPIQNSLLELWGLVHYIDPTGTLLGDLSTFREIFCPDDARALVAGQEHELQRRLSTVLKRTLRRQAQEFMREPFVGRQARLFDYSMSPEERSLYDDVTAYLLEPDLHAFRGNQRTLLLLSFHRLMASSQAALSKSLERVASRLRRLRDRGTANGLDRDAMVADLEEDDEPLAGGEDDVPPADRASVEQELVRVEDFIARARALPTDGKALALLSAIRTVRDQVETGRTSGKLVIFTESLTTQDYLQQLLVASGLVGEGDITTFRGRNESRRAAEALRRWNQEIGARLDPASRPSPDIAMRLALVHEFRTRSRVFISTEAGAKGLNLQFCDTVVNYDLPWNPQRIEQRIGRCHRYGQKRDVTVINFLARDNEAQRLTFEILSQKLDLFGTVLGASDEVLHHAATPMPESLAGNLGAEFEAQLRRIYERARTLDEIERELRELRDAMDSRRRTFEEAQRRTEQVIRSRFDSSVRQVFARIQEELPRELAAFDRDLERVVVAYLDAVGASYELRRSDDSAELIVGSVPGATGPLADSVHVLIGNARTGSELRPLHLGHPLVQAAIADARAKGMACRFAVRVDATIDLEPLRGRRGRLRLLKVEYRGFETAERLLPVVVLAGDTGPLPASLGEMILAAPMADAPPGPVEVSEEAMDDACDELLFADTGDASRGEEPRVARALEQIDRFVEDRILLIDRRREGERVRLAAAEAARDRAVGSDQRTRAEADLVASETEIERLDGELARLRARDDEVYQRWYERTHERRYRAPAVTRLADAELTIT